MKQYSFLQESKDDITIHYYDSYTKLSTDQKNQIQDLINDLDNMDYKYFKEIDSKASSVVKSMYDSDKIKEIDSGKYTFITAEKENKIIGIVFIHPPCKASVGKNAVRYVVVDKKYRGMGIGIKLLNYVKNKYKNNLFIKVVANNNPAYNLYTKVGFKPWLISMVM